MSVFQQFFNKKKHGDPLPLEPIPAGHPFPMREATNGNSTIQVVLFISLTCRSCIELLERLPEGLRSYGGGLLLYILGGTAEELQEIRTYFGFDFPIHSLSYAEGETTYRIQTTPYAYLISHEEGLVLTSGRVNNLEDLQAIMSL